jgi:hypothetical protein
MLHYKIIGFAVAGRLEFGKFVVNDANAKRIKSVLIC